MFDEESLERLKDTSMRLQNIFDICNEFGGICNALQDSKMAQPAIVMHLIVCKENIEKIVFSGNNVSEFLTKEDMRGFKAIRNIATHDYDGLNFAIIEATIKEYLPPIKERIDLFLQQQIN